MQVESPQCRAVFQRDARDRATIPVRATGVRTPVSVCLLDAHGSQVAAEVRVDVADGALTGAVAGVPTGGPYTLGFAGGQPDGGTVEIDGLLVGDLWVLAGQSNMDGVGKLHDLEAPSDRVHAFYYGDRWDIAEDPFCWYNEAVDPIHWGSPENREAAAAWDRAVRATGAGLGLALGKELERRTGVPIGLLVCSHGGTSLAQWSPDLLHQGGASLYGSTARRIAAVGGKVKGVAWYQGESDAMDPGSAASYARNFAALVSSVRGLVGDPGLAWVYVQIGCFYVDGASRGMVEGWDAVQDAQVRVESDIQPAAMTTAIDLSLSDAIHVDTPGLRRLGQRLGYLAHKVAYGSADGEIGPRPAGVAVAPDRKSALVRFDSVNGRLRPEGRVVGMAVYSADEIIAPTCCKLDADGRSVVLEYAEPLPAGAALYYGRGLNPACGLADEADLPVPAFGPVGL